MALGANSIFYHGNQFRIDFTPSGADVECGEIVDIGQGLIGFCTSVEGIEDGVLGALDIGPGGAYKVAKDETTGPVFALGDLVGWDFGTSLAVPADDATADAIIGICIEAAGASDDHVKIIPNPTINAGVQAAAAAAIDVLVDNTGGVVSDTIANTAGANPTTAEFEAAVASLAAKINEVIAALQQ